MDNYIAGIFIKSVSREGHRSEITASSKRRTGHLIFGCLQENQAAYAFYQNKALSNKSEPSMKQETKNVILFGKRSRSDISSFKACYFSENILYC